MSVPTCVYFIQWLERNQSIGNDACIRWEIKMAGKFAYIVLELIIILIIILILIIIIIIIIKASI